MRAIIALALLTGCVTPMDQCRRNNPNASAEWLQQCAAREWAYRQRVSQDLQRVSDDLRQSDQERRLQDLEQRQRERDQDQLLRMH